MCSTTPAYSLTKYTYTGQYSYITPLWGMDDPTTTGITEGFGLMFYNARWYDPALGRFAQADTIVPGGVQGLDRYAYVRNSPLIFTDPTGNKEYCGDDPQCPNDAPDEIDNELLSLVPGDKTGASGVDLYTLYQELWRNKNAWYWQNGIFTIWDFITLIFYKEAWVAMGSPSNTYTAYQEAWSRSFHTWCSANSGICDGSSSPASVLNYLAVASDSAGGLVENPASALLPLKSYNGVVPISAAAPITAGLFNSEWQRGCIGNRPCYVGNFSLFSADMAHVANKRPWFYTKWGGGDPMYIMTPCQSYYWWGGYWETGGNKLYRQDYPNCQGP